MFTTRPLVINEHFNSFAMLVFHQGRFFVMMFFFSWWTFFREVFCLENILPGGLQSCGFLTAYFFPSCIFTWWLFSGCFFLLTSRLFVQLAFYCVAKIREAFSGWLLSGVLNPWHAVLCQTTLSSGSAPLLLNKPKNIL